FPVPHWGLHRLPGERPEVSGGGIAAEHVLAPLVADQVLLPAGEAIEGGVGAPRIAGAGLRDDRAVIAGADDVDPRARRVRPGNDEFRAVIREVAVLRPETAFHQVSTL